MTAAVIRVAGTSDEFAFCAEINNAVNPDSPVTAEQLASAVGTLLVHGGGGYAYVDRSSVPGCAFAMVRVRPEARGRGIGGVLLGAAGEQAGALECESMWGRVREVDADSLLFAAKRGFHEVTRDVDVRLEVAPGDGEVASGIVELGDEHRGGAYAVAAECIPEMALPQHAEAGPFEQWLEREERDSAVAFVALDGGEVVGYARLSLVPALPHRVENGLTAVRRSHRRRGIATSLKRAQIAWAAARGYRELVTSMVDGNVAMRAVNERLGYKPLPAWIVVRGPAVGRAPLPLP
jgi:GNAT superfamily N-acetyltransferase